MQQTPEPDQGSRNLDPSMKLDVDGDVLLVSWKAPKIQPTATVLPVAATPVVDPHIPPVPGGNAAATVPEPAGRTVNLRRSARTSAGLNSNLFSLLVSCAKSA